MEDGLYIGIDTHKEFHAFCALDERGAVALEGTCAASEAAYEGLCRSLEEAGRPARVAIEGSSSYGRGLSDHMRRRGYDVREAVRPGRRAYSSDGKTDAVDALAAARLAFWDQCAGEPKDNGGPSEDLAYLVAARESAVKEWRSAGNALQGLVAKAPSDVREPFAGLKGEALARAVAESGDMGRPDLLAALRSLARRWTAAFEEAEALAGRMEAIVRAHYAPLLGAKGVGVVTAASLAAIAGGNPGRFKSEAAFAKSMGACPIPASSGKNSRMRLNRGGNRAGNRALYQIVIARLSRDEATRAYMEKKRAKGKGKAEAIRCLKRYVAREVYRLLLECAEHRELPDAGELRERRRKLKVTQAAAADALGVSAARVSTLERGVTVDSALAERYSGLLDELERERPL